MAQFCISKFTLCDTSHVPAKLCENFALKNAAEYPAFWIARKLDPVYSGKRLSKKFILKTAELTPQKP